MICGQPVPALVSMNGITQRIIEPLYWLFDDVEVAKFAIDTATIFEIKVTVALPFYSTLTTLVAQWQKINLPKSVLHLLKLFSLFNILLFFWFFVDVVALRSPIAIWSKMRDKSRSAGNRWLLHSSQFIRICIFRSAIAYAGKFQTENVSSPYFIALTVYFRLNSEGDP